MILVSNASQAICLKLQWPRLTIPYTQLTLTAALPNLAAAIALVRFPPVFSERSWDTLLSGAYSCSGNTASFSHKSTRDTALLSQARITPSWRDLVGGPDASNQDLSCPATTQSPAIPTARACGHCSAWAHY